MRVFLAAPFASKIDTKTGAVKEDFQTFVKGVKALLANRGADVYSAQEIEKWGKGGWEDAACTARDFNALRQADVVFALLDNDVSGGVHFELGWASALGKRIFIAAPRGTRLCSLAKGLSSVATVHILFYESQEDLLRQVSDMRADGVL